MEVLGIRPPDLKPLLSPWAKSGRRFSLYHNEVNPIPLAGSHPCVNLCYCLRVVDGPINILLELSHVSVAFTKWVKKKFSVWEA